MPLTLLPNAALQDFNTMAIPAVARNLVEVTDVDELRRAVSLATETQQKMLVLGEGSNTIFADDFSGLVILNRIKGVTLLSESADKVVLKVGAGESWHDFVATAVEQGWYGLENLALIPGLMGAAPIQNIGAYGVEIKDYLTAVEMLQVSSGELVSLSSAQCEFGYRDSVFKQRLQGESVITAVLMELSKEANLKVSYPALKAYFSGVAKITPRQVFQAVCEIRRTKLPDPAKIPNTGSFFKNPVVTAEQHRALLQRYPDLISYPAGSNYKVAAGYLIERAGWKDKELNGVTVHQAQALVIINPRRQNGQFVLEFARAIQADIKIQFGLDLEIEPRIYP
jgi:UDP-N-acetylmuramate dehydrogenase